MNDLIIPSETLDNLPNIREGILKAKQLFDEVQSFEDLERTFLRGEGLGAGTYRTYLQSVKSFYQFTEGRHPFQVRPADIEAWYDSMRERLDLATCYNRIMGLKRFFVGIEKQVPYFMSPYNKMSETLKRKLNKTKKGNRTKKALLKGELQKLLAWLKKDSSVKGLENYAIVLTLVTSSLRASELCQLNWKDLDQVEGKYVAYFTGKGDQAAEQELHPDAVEAAKRYFKKQFDRFPKPGDCFFYELVKRGPLRKGARWVRIRDMGQAAREAGIIKRDLQFSPHLFRRTFASLLYKEGMDIKSLQEATRHAQVTTLMRHYVDSSEATSPYFDKILKRGA